jgi:hypothetical protein
VRKVLLVLAFLGAAMGVAAAASALARTDGPSRAPSTLKPFRRPAVAGDALPRGALGPLRRSLGRVVASRRVATTSGRRGPAALYLARLGRNYICLIQIDRGAAGAGCDRAGQSALPGPRIRLGGGDGFLHGLAGDEISRVILVDHRARVHPVRLTRDGGFLYTCRARIGCIAAIDYVNGYDARDRLVFHERW